MSRRYQKSAPYEHNGHCLICSKSCPGKTSRDSIGWDWFCGYLGVVVHFCPQHRTGELRDRLLMIGGRLPHTWTRDEQAFVNDFKRELEKLEQAARLAALEAAEKEVVPVAWQPIETAPKDGRMFLGWVDAVRYGESDEGAQFEVNVSEHDFCRWNERDGYVENMMGQIGDAYHVTHWMPLPAAPGADNPAPASKDAIRREALDGEPSLQALYEDVCIEANKNAQDARRYRWLRDFDVRCKDGVDINPPCEIVHASMYAHAVGTIPAVRLVTGGELDRAIDDALSQKVGDQQ